MLKEKKEEIHSMATTYPLIYGGLSKDRYGVSSLLNAYCFNHDVYDILAVLDSKGRFVAINTTDRLGTPLPNDKLAEILGGDIGRFPEEKKLFDSSITGGSSSQDWYRSKLVQNLYDHHREDISYQYNIALSEPIRDPSRPNEIIGVWLNVLSWAYIQNILDNVETDLANLDLRTGYGFLLSKDADTIIGHKRRLNRKVGSDNFYNMKLVEDCGLEPLHDAIMNQVRDFAYEYPAGSGKISGLAPIDDPSFGWIVGVEVEQADVFRPIRILAYWLLGATVLLAFLVILFTYVIAGE
jgi:hypothetical protein